MQRLYQYKALLNQGIGMGEFVENSELQLPCDLINSYFCEDCGSCFGIKTKATHIGNHLGCEKYLCLKHARIFEKMHSNQRMSFCMSFDKIMELDKTKPIGLVPFSKQECLSIYHLNLHVYTQQMKSLCKQFDEPFIIQIYVHPEESRTFFKIDPYSRAPENIRQKYSKETLTDYWEKLKNLVLFYDYRNDNLIFELMLNKMENHQ